MTLQEVFDEFLNAKTSLKPNTIRTYRQLVEGPLKSWLNRPLANITKHEVSERHADISRKSGGAHADAAMRTLGSIWSYAAATYEDEQGESLFPEKPTRRLSVTRAWHRPAPRKDAIRAHQLPAWFEAVRTLREQPWGSYDKTCGDFFVFLLLNGIRFTEGASLTWSQIDMVDRRFTLLNTKNRTDHVLPLSDYCHDLLQARYSNRNPGSDFVFPSYGKKGYIAYPHNPIKKITEGSGVKFIPHDLRRTFITMAAQRGVPVAMVSQLANHGIGNPVTRGYIVENVEMLREPMQAITDHILRAAGVRLGSKVVHISEARA